jgi:hypothetical protein
MQVHKAMLDLLKTVAKQLEPEVLAGYLGAMLEATKVSNGALGRGGGGGALLDTQIIFLLNGHSSSWMNCQSIHCFTSKPVKGVCACARACERCMCRFSLTPTQRHQHRLPVSTSR